MDMHKIARSLAEDSFVLLQNRDDLLPFGKGQKIALFGRGQAKPAYSGSGSGAAGGKNMKLLAQACQEEGIIPVSELLAFYQEKVEEELPLADGEIDWSKGKQLVNSGLMYELFGRYHPPVPEYEIPEALLDTTAQETDTAVLILSRNAGGEECDRHLEGDYELTESEKNLIRNVCARFPEVVVIVNTNGLIDLSWKKQYPEIKSILFTGVFGEAGTEALAGVLSGRVNPSGKLPVTIAASYSDYPSAKDFSWDKDKTGEKDSGQANSANEINRKRNDRIEAGQSKAAMENQSDGRVLTYEDYGLSASENGSRGFSLSPVTVYREDVFNGYRYFDTFGVKPLFPFGFGLSYTSFALVEASLVWDKGGCLVKCRVQNTGARAGREVLQLYSSLTGSGTSHPRQELRDFTKTGMLEPGQTEEEILKVHWRDLAQYDEDSSVWVIRKGDYRLCLGNSSDRTVAVAVIHVLADVETEKVHCRLGLKACNWDKITFLQSPEDRETLTEESRGIREYVLCPGEVKASGKLNYPTETEKPENKERSRGIVRSEAADRVNEIVGNYDKAESVICEDEVSKLSDEQLAALCVGYGPGTAFSAFKDIPDPDTLLDEKGEPLTVNDHPMGRKGYVSPAIPSEGIHSITYQDGPAGIGLTAWPSEMLLACSFDREALHLFGEAIGEECRQKSVDVLLAPAVNLHRNPLCGRNFEYFSEDPFLTGICALEMTKGVQAKGVLVCPKHFAVNEQETFRRGSSRRGIDACDSILTERAARELYLKPFETLVREGNVHVIMTSFNKINGTFAAGNADLCTNILREEWGYQGIVVTDWGDMDTVVDGADAVAAGNDIVMPGGPPVIRQILKGLEDKRVSRKDLERAVRRLAIVSRMCSRAKCTRNAGTTAR